MSNQKVFPVGKNSDFTGVQMASYECGFFCLDRLMNASIKEVILCMEKIVSSI